MREMTHDFKPEYSIYPASQSGAKTGDAIVDLQGHEGAMIVCGSGDLTTDTVFQLMHGDQANLSDAEAVPDDQLVGTEPTLLEATDNEIKHFSYVGTKRYVRVDTTAGAGIAWAAVIKGRPRHAPVA